MTRTTGENVMAGQLEPGTRFACKQCGSEFEAKNRNGVKKEFCSDVCRDRWKNAQRLKGAALLKAQKSAVQRPRKACATSIRTIDQLSAAEGLPAGSYGAGALGRIGRRSVATMIPPSQRLGLLVEAAQRLGLTDEGEALKAARLAARLAQQGAAA